MVFPSKHPFLGGFATRTKAKALTLADGKALIDPVAARSGDDVADAENSGTSTATGGDGFDPMDFLGC